MDQYIGLDVSLKDTAISIREDGKRIWRGKRASDPKVLAQVIRKHAPNAKRVIFETGPLSTWFYPQPGKVAECINLLDDWNAIRQPTASPSPTAA